uniref:MAGUK p55 subfamily member 7 n=1 Tax=Oryzias sinensis TaxID=183150 RepID=A0A8C8DVX9_9TELE
MLSQREHQGVCKLLSLVMSETESPTYREEDYRFLHSMLMEKKVHLLFKIHERLKCFERQSCIPVMKQAAFTALELVEELKKQNSRDEVKELCALFSKPHFKNLLQVHDTVAQKDFEPSLAPVPDDALDEEEDSVKIVSLVKTKEPLGATIKKDKSTGAIVVARIMRGGAADKSGLIHEGDELKEVNGVPLEYKKPKEILPLLARSQSEIKFKIVPGSFTEDLPSDKIKLFVQALFDYSPLEDPTVPCKDAAMAFKRGDVLQIVNMDDDTWWQARSAGNDDSRAGLIPSKQLQERRFMLQRPKPLFKPQRPRPADEGGVSSSEEGPDYAAITGIHIPGLRRSFRLSRKSSRTKNVSWFWRWSTEVHGVLCPHTYREVVPSLREAKDKHRLVILIGPSGVGVNELKRRLVISDPDRYGISVPYTTREKKGQEREGVDYHFVSVHKFEEDILNHRLIEYGSYRGHYYGTSLDSVHRVMVTGKMCLMDVHPSKIKFIDASKFKPHVVFVKPPNIEELRLTRRRVKFLCDKGDPNQVRTFTEENFQDMIDLAETMEIQYGHLFDKIIINGDVTTAFKELKEDLEKLAEPGIQWVPAEWSRPTLKKTQRSCGHLTGLF